MAANKVIYGGETLVDLTMDSVTPETLAKGVTAHDKSGNQITGTMSLLNNHDITLGVHTDGLLYIFIDGVPTGNGVSMPDKVGDVYGNVDSGNNIVLQGALADGTYSVKYEMENGETVNIGNLVLDTNVYYTVTKNLSYCSINNSATSVIEGEPYSATISANEGYELKSVTVTMGGNPVSVTNGVINISSVTGDIVITAVAEETVSEPTNQIPISQNADGTLFVGTNGEKGYKTGYRLSKSSGNESALADCEVTGFIPATNTSVIRIKNIPIDNSNAVIVAYDASHNKLESNGIPLTSLFPNSAVNGVYTSIGFGGFTHLANAALAYIRICSMDINENSILTVNEEIA